MGKTKTYWKGIEELKEDKSFLKVRDREFNEYVPIDQFVGDDSSLADSSTSRRDFLKFLGFGVTAATIASCETPVTKAIPYLIKPEEVTPGVANWYASTYYDGNDYSSILVKTREGRPILIEGNKLSALTKGGLNARVNSSVLMLYDSNRLQGPIDKDGNQVTWDALDAAVTSKLKAVAATGGKIRLLTNTVISPSTQSVIDNFAATYGGEGKADVKQVTYDSISYSGIIEANEASFGKANVPQYNFDKAKTVVGIGADFLSTWLNSAQYVGPYTSNRKPGADMSRHYQFEAGLSVTGANADKRVRVKPSQYGQVVLNLYNAVAGMSGAEKLAGSNEVGGDAITAAAKDLLASKGKSLVVCGSNSKDIQTLVNGINSMLGNYGSTIDLDHPSYLKKGKDADMKMLAEEMNKGEVKALIICGGNPAVTVPSSLNFTQGLEKVGFKVSMNAYRNETAAACDYTCAESHMLESWSDAHPAPGHYSLGQPTISNLYNTRQCQDNLLAWTGSTEKYYDVIRNYWKNNLMSTQTETVVFEQFWNKVLHDGVYTMSAPESHEALTFAGDVRSAASKAKAGESDELEIFLYQKTGIGDGSHANNPWLQELPDPISKITWDNYVTMAPEDMEEHDFNPHLGQEQSSNMVQVTLGGFTSEAIPVVAQPGQVRGTIGLALGYGKMAWKEKQKVGVDAYPFVTFNGNVQYHASGVSITDAGTSKKLAATQTSHTVMGREGVIKETTLDVYAKGDRNEFNPVMMLPTHDGKKDIKGISLWEEHPVETSGHLWGMSIDLNTCIGCGACVTACTAENNVPVVGQDEVRRSREMHWLRIDRYYSTDADENDTSIGGYRNMENPGANPEVVFQPMMCQHCNHAPCETVCPVAATTHSLEGLNQMTYNRCIGTRYCANNCPYKVRRFNWFNYMADRKFTDFNPAQDDLGRMVLNPDVVVRARGVMEKCSLCVQRIQAGKLEAKKAGTKVADGAITTACSAACSTGAITFGDLNDKNSRVAELEANDRAYRVIEEVGTKPNIVYQTKVRNSVEAEA